MHLLREAAQVEQRVLPIAEPRERLR